MVRKIILDTMLQDQFHTDWESISLAELTAKYGACKNVIKKLARQFNCVQPKPQVSANPQIISGRVLNSNRQGNIGLDHNEGLQACNEEFLRVINDMTMPKREKDELLFNIATKAIGIFISQSPTAGQFNQGMVSFYKLKLYERRIDLSNKENAQIDAMVIKNLKKKYIQEAMDAIIGELSTVERRFFDFLVQLATTRLLAHKKKLNEAQQHRAMELNGHIVPVQ